MNLLQQPRVNLTDVQLSLYDGTNPDLPIYVAINGSVYDVSANPSMYGPGGGYHFFSGRDAARAFVSGCFGQDLTWDLRGLEEMYITAPEDDADAKEIGVLEERLRNGDGGKGFGDDNTKGGVNVESRLRWLNRRRDKRRVEARGKVSKQIEHWQKFYADHDRYFFVGSVVHESLEDTPLRSLCAGNQKPGSSS
jgi:predicted heme/steroid binding protein